MTCKIELAAEWRPRPRTPRSATSAVSWPGEWAGLADQTGVEVDARATDAKVSLASSSTCARSPSAMARAIAAGVVRQLRC